MRHRRGRRGGPRTASWTRQKAATSATVGRRVHVDAEEGGGRAPRKNDDDDDPSPSGCGARARGRSARGAAGAGRIDVNNLRDTRREKRPVQHSQHS